MNSLIEFLKGLIKLIPFFASYKAGKNKERLSNAENRLRSIKDAKNIRDNISDDDIKLLHKKYGSR